MAIVMTPIYTQTVGADGANTVTFNNIPQTFTDLLIKCSTRSDSNDGSTSPWRGQVITFNGDSTTSIYSVTFLYGQGTSAASVRDTTTSGRWGYWANGNNATANTFGNSEIYLANYAGNNFKTWSSDVVGEHNGTNSLQLILAGLWRSTNAITSISLGDWGSGKVVQNSTFTLYGIIRSGA